MRIPGHFEKQALSGSLVEHQTQERYCAMAAPTMPADRPPLRVEARNRLSSRKAQQQQSDRLKRNTGPFGEPLLHTAFANPGSAKSARHCRL
jgi:hypothetical protein